MTLRAVRRFLWSCILLSGMGAALALAWTLFWPLDVVTPPPVEQPDGREQEAATAHEPGITLQDFANHWNRTLRGPLEDPPPPKPVQREIRRPTPPPVKLIGTMIEEGAPHALLQTGPSDLQVLRIGDTLDGKVRGAEVVSITVEEVVLRYGGTEFSIRIESPTK